MFSTLLRAISWIILAGGVIIAVVDATRSVASGRLQLTDIGVMLETYVPAWAEKLDDARMALAGSQIGSWQLSGAIDYLSAIPVALLAAGLFLLMYGLASRKRDQPHF